VVVCGARHVHPILRQLADVGVFPRLMVSEPVGRNTAPAVALAASLVDPDEMLLVLPADHVVTDVQEFRQVVATAIEPVAAGALVTFGITPRSPETGYGYIEVGEITGGVHPVASFVEKPDRATAERYLASGRYLWNSGMFAFRAGVVLDQLRLHAPAVMDAVAAALAEVTSPGEVVVPGPTFDHAPSISLDHAVMERTDRAVVIPFAGGWSDVGSWSTLWELDAKDEHGNVVRGDAVVLDVNRSYVRADGRLVVVIGLDDVVVVDTGDAVLVARRDRVQDVRAVVERLAGRPEVDGPDAR
jgi:mannose-1-phosphate guanylyltransferase/mannose-6-phosphate isomerase